MKNRNTVPIPQPSIKLRSEEVQEIISRPPNTLVRWGLTVFLFVFILFFILTWRIKYPDVIKAKVTITTEPAPVNLVSRTSGKIELWQHDNSLVNANDPIAFIESNAMPRDVLYIDSIASLPDSVVHGTIRVLSLGDLQNAFSQWEKAKENRNLFYQNEIASKQIAHFRKQIVSYKKLVSVVQGQLKIMRQELNLAKGRFKTDSTLFYEKVISAIDFNKAQADYLVQQRNLKNSEMTLINNELQITSLEKQITEIEASKIENEEKLTTEVEHTQKELRAQILKWEETFLFIAPIQGSLSYLDFLEQGKYIEAGKPIFSVIPSSKEIIGRAELPIAGSGKVKEGQTVNIRLDNFPYEQYGMLHGKVKEISSLPTENKYLVKIDLADTLNTTTQKHLIFKQQMQGETEIITEDLRLLERFFYQFRTLTKR